ncbi:hypothetical protein C8J57DRAFT_212349 [Mycena rebaudengoi]|nr:hypothetical protein C8J57DRAFT_212349 [Mycena rebaudengoi]
MPDDRQPIYHDELGRPITPEYDADGRVVHPLGRTTFDAGGRPITPPRGRSGRSGRSHIYEPEEVVPVPPSGRSAPSVRPVAPSAGPGYDGRGAPTVQSIGGEHAAPVPIQTPMYDAEGRPVPAEYGDRRYTEETTRPLPGRPISPGRYSPRPTVTPFPADLAQADAERERLERLAEVENRLQEVVDNAEVAEEQRENDFRRHEEDRERLFMESEERREQEAKERRDAIWRDLEGLGASGRPPTLHPDLGDLGDGASIHTVQAASEQAASLLAASIKETVQAEREQFAREREEMAAERAQLAAERDAARDQADGGETGARDCSRRGVGDTSWRTRERETAESYRRLGSSGARAASTIGRQ